jgi:hypothetical protein
MPWVASGGAVVHSEEAFRHLLALERHRAARAGRGCLLALVRLPPAWRARLTPRTTAVFFSALEGSLREIDAVGWFRMERVAGAVLAQGGGFPGPGAMAAIADRVSRALADQVPSDGGRLRVRIVRLGAS